MSNLATIPTLTASGLVSRYLARGTEATRLAYGHDVAHFATFLGVETVTAAAEALLSHGSHHASMLASDWRTAMEAAGLSPATVARRLAALRSLVRLGRTLGLVEWDLFVESPRTRGFRDTRGPERSAYLGALGRASVRDRAALMLLGSRGLRRGEVTALDLSDFDSATGALLVRRKGQKAEPVRVTLGPSTARALLRWVEERGSEPGPLFHHKGRRLSGNAIRDITRKYGLGAPHGLRHAAITHALDVTNGNVRAVRHYSGHAKVDTVIVYDDQRTDEGGRIAALTDAPEVTPDGSG